MCFNISTTGRSKVSKFDRHHPERQSATHIPRLGKRPQAQTIPHCVTARGKSRGNNESPSRPANPRAHGHVHSSHRLRKGTLWEARIPHLHLNHLCKAQVPCLVLVLRLQGSTLKLTSPTLLPRIKHTHSRTHPSHHLHITHPFPHQPPTASLVPPWTTPPQAKELPLSVLRETKLGLI